MLPQFETLVRNLRDDQLRLERERLVANRQHQLGEYEQAVANEYARRGFYKIFSDDSEFQAATIEEFVEQFRGMGLPVTEYGTFANMHCADWSIKFGEHTWLQVRNGVGAISYYTGEGSCSWVHDLTSYVEVAMAVSEYLVDGGPMPVYMKRIAKVTGIEDRAVLRRIEDAMRAENHGLLDGLTADEFDRAARRMQREL